MSVEIPYPEEEWGRIPPEQFYKEVAENLYATTPKETKPSTPARDTKAEMMGQEIKLSWSFDFKYLAIALIVIALLWLVFK